MPFCKGCPYESCQVQLGLYRRHQRYPLDSKQTWLIYFYILSILHHQILVLAVACIVNVSAPSMFLNLILAYPPLVLLRLDIASKNSVSLSANHLQKLRLSFQLATPLGNPFKPHQAMLKLRHESKLEHVFVVPYSGNKFEITLDFLGLVEKLYYLSGKYDIELSVGDALMENSFLWSVGHVDLELPEAPEKATRPPSAPVDPYSRYGPKAEITHIFRSPEKLPPKNLSLAFLGLVFLPLVGFLVGLLRLGVNFKNFPSSGLPAIFAILFHVGIAAVLGLYVLFWLKLNLFVTLKYLGFLGVFLVFVGHRILSHLASSSAKLKSA